MGLVSYNTTTKRKAKKNRTNRKRKLPTLTRQNKNQKKILYQKQVSPERINNWMSIAEQRQDKSPQALTENLNDCAHNSLLLLEDIKENDAKVASKVQNCSRKGISGDEFLELFKNNQNVKKYNFQLEKLCIENIITELKEGYSCYLLFIRKNGIGHAVVLRNINGQFTILDPQRRLAITDLFKYINDNKISKVYTIIQETIANKQSKLSNLTEKNKVSNNSKNSSTRRNTNRGIARIINAPSSSRQSLMFNS